MLGPMLQELDLRAMITKDRIDGKYPSEGCCVPFCLARKPLCDSGTQGAGRKMHLLMNCTLHFDICSTFSRVLPLQHILEHQFPSDEPTNTKAYRVLAPCAT
jgi:hypothetical protein